MRLLRGALGALAAASLPLFAQSPATASFTVFLKGRVLGAEQVTVSTDSTGHVIDGTARHGPPLDVTLKRVHIKYDANWMPVETEIDGMAGGRPVTLTKPSGAGTIAPDAIVLANGFFGSYEALAARLQDAKAGSTFRAVTVPQPEMSVAIRIAGMADERVQLAGGAIQVKRYELIVDNSSGPVDVSLSIDDTGRLVRLQIPSESFDVVRNDVASVSARREIISHPGDEQVHIPAYGFTLAATATRPFDSAQGRPATGRRWPAVVLIGGSGPMDRDETVAGIPIMGQLAGALADAGFFTIRYDKRGVGQSGGRSESSTLQDYAEDARAVIKYVADRKDVDRERLAVLGHSEGGWVAMLAAAKEKNKVDGLVLLATPGTTGADLVLQQQRHTLDLMQTPQAERDEKIVLQRRIHRAVLTGRGWEDIPEPMRKRADIPWFHSFLGFDPVKALSDLRQPVLIVHGALDRQVPPEHAERLAAIARGRKKVAQPPVVKVLPGLNHLFVTATSGEVEEYAVLAEHSVSPDVSATIADWLRGLWPSPNRQIARSPDRQIR